MAPLLPARGPGRLEWAISIAGLFSTKVCTSGGVLSVADDPSAPQFTVEEIGAAVYEATAHSKRCMAHAQSTVGIKNALKAGISSIEHGIWLDDEAIDTMKKQSVYLVPTLVAPRDQQRVPLLLAAVAAEVATAAKYPAGCLLLLPLMVATRGPAALAKPSSGVSRAVPAISMPTSI